MPPLISTAKTLIHHKPLLLLLPFLSSIVLPPLTSLSPNLFPCSPLSSVSSPYPSSSSSLSPSTSPTSSWLYPPSLPPPPSHSSSCSTQDRVRLLSSTYKVSKRNV